MTNLLVMRSALLLVLSLAGACCARAQPERAAVLPEPSTPAALDAAAHAYARAWLRADSSAMAAAVHPAARRQIVTQVEGAVLLEEQDAATMAAAAAGLTPDPDAERDVVVRVLVADRTSGVVDVELPLWSERVTFVRWNDRWRVVHAAWRLREEP